MGDYRILAVDPERKTLHIEGDGESCAAAYPRQDGAQAFVIIARLPKHDGNADIFSHHKISLQRQVAWIMPDAVIELHDIP